MRFCKQLINDINFEPRGIQPCCNTRALRVPSMPYDGGPLDVAAYQNHISEIIQGLQTDSPWCRGCPELEVIDIGSANGVRLDMKFKSVSINMHRHICNCKCVYCDLWGKSSSCYQVLPGIQSLHEQGILDPACFISWGGGEPSILGEFEEASDWISRQGYFQYIHTNALIFSPCIERLLRNGAGAINVSLDSGSPEVYFTVKGVDRFGKVVANLEKYAAAANSLKQIHMKYIVFEKNNSTEEIQHFLDLCKRLGVSTVQVSLNFVEVNADAVSRESYVGAKFLLERAEQMGLKPNPFFLD